MKQFALSLVLVLACAALAFAAVKAEDSALDTQDGKAATTAAGQKAPAKTKAHTVVIRDVPRPGDITVKGKAGSETTVGYGQPVKPEPGGANSGVKPSGQ